MKTFYAISICLITILSTTIEYKKEKIDVNVILGTWKIDMSPHDKTDENFAIMKISQVKEQSFEGEFYRKGVKIRKGKLNTQLGIIYGALISGDGTGDYNTTFYYKKDVLHGTTHAVDRDFLSVWTATRITD